MAKNARTYGTGVVTLVLLAVGCASGLRTGTNSPRPPGGERVTATPPAITGVPADKLDLENWKLTLPVGETFSPKEVKQPELSSFADNKYFYLSEEGVVLRAHSGGVTTPHSNYPRSELREMANGGTERASWSTKVGRHTMRYSAAITHLPQAKPHVVAGQILGPEDDIVMIRLERTHLFVEGGGNNLGTLTRDYQLGTYFDIVLDASGGRIRVFFNDEQTPRVNIKREFDGCYFKIGAYPQSSIKRGDAHDAYGEVVLRALAVDHAD